MAMLRRLPDSARSALVLGHNPSLQTTAQRLVKDGKPAALKQLNEKFPTAALAVIDLEIERWEDLAPDCGKLLELALPSRDREGGD
jgi:phosphohistidine phosphatase